MLPYNVYILFSSVDQQYYAGYTSNLKRRLQQHFDGEVKSTVRRRPLQLIFYEGYMNQRDALAREKYFKTTAGKRALKIMLSNTRKQLGLP